MTQTVKRLLACTLFSIFCNIIHAQDQTAATPDQPAPESDSAIAARQALRFGDSLVKASFLAEWPTYMALSCPSAIKYYGGKNAFQEHVIELHYRNEPKLEEKPETLKLLSLLNSVDTWQCVLEKVRETVTDGHGKTKIYTYLIGESTDNGLTWKFVDVSQNSIENVINLLPTIFGNLAIPEGKTVYVEEVAAQEAAQAEKKKPVVKKHAK